MIPAEAELTRRHDEIPAWDDMPDDLKPVLARQMEVYAGFLEHTDHHVGRLIDALDDLGILDNTLVYYIIGDNGASAEGSLTGSFNELMMLNGAGALETPEFMASHIDDFGTPKAYNHYAVGWAHAMCAPYQWTKQVASHWGGTRNGTIVHWPAGIAAKGEVRDQFHHVIDVAPTVLDAAGLPEPTFVHGVQQHPYEGVSMRYAFDEASAPGRHETQYFEMFCNRGIYHNGWTAVTRHSMPWDMSGPMPAFADDVWELYADTDWTQAHDLATEMPDRLAHLQQLWLIEVSKYNVLPLDDRRVERFNSDLAGRPLLIKGTQQILFNGMRRLSENSVLNVKNKSHTITCEIEVKDDRANGVVISQGGEFGGWSVYLIDGTPKYCYNLFGLRQFHVSGDAKVSAGNHQVRVEFTYDGGGLGKGGNAAIYLDGSKVGEGRIDATVPMVFSGGRDARPRQRHRLTGEQRVHVGDEHVHGHRELGAARHRRRRHRPLHHSRGAHEGRHGPPVEDGQTTCHSLANQIGERRRSMNLRSSSSSSWPGLGRFSTLGTRRARSRRTTARPRRRTARVSRRCAPASRRGSPGCRPCAPGRSA